MKRVAHLCLVLSDVDKCRRSSEIMVTYNPSFTSGACPSSSAAAAGGGVAVSAENSVASLASSRSTSNSSFSPPSSTCRPQLGPHTSSQSRDGHHQAPAPLHRPHSVTGLCCCCTLLAFCCSYTGI